MINKIGELAQFITQFIAQVPRKLFPVFTWGNRPDASKYLWGFIWVTDIAGGVLLRSNGTRWVPVSQSVTLANFNTDISVSATTSEEILRSITVPGGLMGPNDSIRVLGISSRSATLNNSTIKFVAGPASSVLSAATTSTVTAVTLPFDALMTNANSKTSQIGSGPGAVAASGIAVQTASIDTSVDFVVSITGQKGVAGDTLTLRRVRFEYIRGIDV